MTKPCMRSKTLIVGKDIVANMLVHLQIKGVILYTIDFNPSQDAFENQVYMELDEKLQIKIKQIKVVTQFTFLVVVSKHEDKKRILMEKFLKLNGMMVLAIPQTIDFDANSMRTTQALVWVELPMVHPVF